MLVEIIAGDEISFYDIQDSHREIKLNEGKIILNQIKDRWQMRTGGSFVVMNIELIKEHLYHIYYCSCDNHITFVYMDDPDETYQPVPVMKAISCSPHSEQIQFISPLLDNMRITIHRDGSIEGDNTSLASINNRRLRPVDTFRNGDCIRVLDARILLHTEFIMVQPGKSIVIHSKKWKPAYGTDQIPSVLTEIRRFPYAFLPEKEIDVHVKPPVITASFHGGGTFQMMASSLVMSSASFASGLLMAYRSYLSGRAWMEILPMLILPAAMMLSAIVLRPLQNYFMNQNRKQKIKEEEDRYIAYLDKLAREINQKKKRIAEAYDFVYPSTDQPGNLVERGTIIRLGKIERSMIHSLKMPDYYECATERIQTALDHFQSEIMQPVSFPYLIDLSKYHLITISGMHKKQRMHSMIVSLVNGSSDIKAGLSENMPEAEEMMYSRTLFHPSGYRRLIHDFFSSAEEGCFYFNASGSEMDISEKSCQITFSEKIEGDLHIAGNPDGSCTAYDLIKRKSEVFQIENVQNSFLIQPYIPSKRIHQNDFFSLYGGRKASEIPLNDNWQNHIPEEHLKARIGTDEKGRCIELDLHEKGDGPHGLIAGTTGSGKSELILTMLLSLAANYSPEYVQFVLIDFKGGGCAQSLRTANGYLPHVAGILCNLDINEMDRALIALKNECSRRERCFQNLHQKSGQTVRNLNDYRILHKNDPDSEDMADLIIVIDEFAELKANRPDFMNDLISIARVGRSLGMHLILSTQKPAGIVNEQIWANTNFKICMKVANRQDSMEVLHHDDASRLTGPGSFILLKDGNRMIRGTAAYAHAESSIRQVVCFDQELRPLANETSGTFQSAELIDSIHQIKTVHPAGQLWKEPVKELSWQMFDDTGGCPIGVIDDIHASAYRLFVLQEKNLYVISMDHQEKERFLMTVLTALLKVRPARMITVIDDLHFSFLKDISDSGRINLLDSSEEEGIISLIQAQKHMKDKLHVLIITDISTFLNAYGHRFPIDNWLGYPRENHMQLILMGINTSALPYKYLSLIPLRCTLKNENSQDIASLFEKGGRYAAHKAGYGLVNDRWGSTFRLIHTRKEDLKEALDVRTDSDLSLFSAGK